MRVGEVGEYFCVGGVEGEGLAGVGGVEVAGEVNEVGDGDRAVVIQIAILPGAGAIEVSGEVNEIGDGDGAVEVEIADARQTDQQTVVTMCVGPNGHANGGAGMTRSTGV